MTRAFITGVSGFVGSHLAELLIKEGLEVHGGIRWRAPLDNISHIPADKLTIHNMDIRDLVSCMGIMNKVKPTYIFHLAGQSYVPESWNAPAETLTTNIIGTSNILESVRKTEIDSVIQMAGSSEEYGLVLPSETPITEDQPLRPQSPYGVSKVACDLLCQQYHKSYGMKTVITRAFNHEGARRGEVFVTSNFAKQIVMIEKGKAPPVIKVGNLDAQRDYTDVRDMVRAYWMAVQSCQLGEPYNICSGNSWIIGDMLHYLISQSTMPDGIAIERDPARMRPSDVPILLGDSRKFGAKTGWEPLIPFRRTLRDTLDYWRGRI
jgi:GDP-4-dehydro-6-deoxy-D-mannose reductase